MQEIAGRRFDFSTISKVMTEVKSSLWRLEFSQQQFAKNKIKVNNSKYKILQPRRNSQVLLQEELLRKGGFMQHLDLDLAQPTELKEPDKVALQKSKITVTADTRNRAVFDARVEDLCKTQKPKRQAVTRQARRVSQIDPEHDFVFQLTDEEFVMEVMSRSNLKRISHTLFQAQMAKKQVRDEVIGQLIRLLGDKQLQQSTQIQQLLLKCDKETFILL